MKKLTLNDFKEVQLWIHRNARQIELAMWQYHFENGSREAVLSALSFYQNNDGGFGNTLEPDSWNPNSSPYTTLYAVNLLRGINFTDIQHPIYQGILRFLSSTEYCSENGWFFSIPTNDDYAHAPWWTYNEEANGYEGIGVTAELSGFILRYIVCDSDIYQKALSYAEVMFNRLKEPGNYGDMGIGGYCALLNDIEGSPLTKRFDCDFLKDSLMKLVNNSIERDISKWPYYNVKPTDYIKTSDSIFFSGNEDIVSKELDYVIETRYPVGVWDITWSWFDNNDRYPKEFAISENWWKAVIAIEKIRVLKNFDRVTGW